MKGYYEDDDFNFYYVIKTDEKYFFSSRLFASTVEFAKKFNTVRSARRSIKLYQIKNYKIEKVERKFT